MDGFKKRKRARKVKPEQNSDESNTKPVTAQVISNEAELRHVDNPLVSSEVPGQASQETTFVTEAPAVIQETHQEVRIREVEQPKKEQGTGETLTTGSRFRATATVALRKSPSRDADILGNVVAGTLVEISETRKDRMGFTYGHVVGSYWVILSEGQKHYFEKETIP